MAQRTVVVIPCYNEAARLRTDEFEAALRDNPNLTFLFVDDGSKDATFTVLTELAERAGERARVLRLPANAGKAEAVRQGVLAALELEPQLVGYWDADLATPLDAIAMFERVLEDPEVALVIGSRVRLLGRNIERTAWRHYLGRAFATAAGLALALPIYDTQCGAKLFRVTPALRDAFSSPFSGRWTFDVELLGRLQEYAVRTGTPDLSRTCVEFPLEQWIHRPGSKLRLWHAPRILLEMAHLFRELRLRRR